jgi:predicted methyltransferase
MSSDPSPKAQSLARLFLQRPSADGSNARSIAWQMDHRLDLVSFWDIAPGSRVLEIGCGQGDCTIVLADAVGHSGHVDAVDPGAPDYGKILGE